MSAATAVDEHSMKVSVTVDGQPWLDKPKDLFIPPDALDILLDSFTGPLDVLLYLIRREKMEITDLPLRQITAQYMHYIELMEERRMSLAVDYLVMAAWLAEIKSRMLLPRLKTVEGEHEDDPRMALVDRLQRYELFKHSAHFLDKLPRYGRDVFAVHVYAPDVVVPRALPDVTLSMLVDVMQKLGDRPVIVPHAVVAEILSVRARIVLILERLQCVARFALADVYTKEEGHLGFMVSFLAALELMKQSHLRLVQDALWMPLYVEHV